jgi:hypothetical protein
MNKHGVNILLGVPVQKFSTVHVIGISCCARTAFVAAYNPDFIFVFTTLANKKP